MSRRCRAISTKFKSQELILFTTSELVLKAMTLWLLELRTNIHVGLDDRDQPIHKATAITAISYSYCLLEASSRSALPSETIKIAQVLIDHGADIDTC